MGKHTAEFTDVFFPAPENDMAVFDNELYFVACVKAEPFADLFGNLHRPV